MKRLTLLALIASTCVLLAGGPAIITKTKWINKKTVALTVVATNYFTFATSKDGGQHWQLEMNTCMFPPGVVASPINCGDHYILLTSSNMLEINWSNGASKGIQFRVY